MMTRLRWIFAQHYALVAVHAILLDWLVSGLVVAALYQLQVLMVSLISYVLNADSISLQWRAGQMWWPPVLRHLMLSIH